MSNRERNEPEENFNPLSVPINEKPYTGSSVNATAEQLARPIGEPTFTAPPQPAAAATGSTGGDNNQQSRPKPPPQQPVNEELRDLPKKDKKKASLHMAQMVITGYEFMHQLASKAIVFGPKRVARVQEAGVSLTEQLQIDENTSMSTAEYIAEFNNQQKDILTVSEEFKEDMIPALQEVFEKKGIGMTPEQYIMYGFAKDIGMKSIMVVGIRSQLSALENALIENAKAMRSGMAPQSGAPSQPQPASNNSGPTPPPYNAGPEMEEPEEAMQQTHTQTGYTTMPIPDGHLSVNQEVNMMTDPENHPRPVIEIPIPAKEPVPKRKPGRKSNAEKFKEK